MSSAPSNEKELEYLMAYGDWALLSLIDEKGLPSGLWTYPVVSIPNLQGDTNRVRAVIHDDAHHYTMTVIEGVFAVPRKYVIATYLEEYKS
jgi:hypothetical protein